MSTTALWGDDCLSIRSGRLRMEEVDLGELAERFGTPLYVHSEHQLRANARSFRQAFSDAWGAGGVLVMPSIKANHSLALRRILTEEGLGCDVFGGGELEAALRGGVEPASISLNGPAKDRALIGRALELGARITIDSLQELERVRELARAHGAPATVRLRAKPWLELDEHTDLTPNPISIRMAAQRYKPGIPTEQLLSLAPEAVLGDELQLSGLMVHIGRLSRDPAIFAELARWTAALASQLHRAWGGWRPREIDLGGGFAVPRDPTAGGHDTPAASLAEYAQAIAGELRAGLEAGGLDPDETRLEIEPGRGLYANTGLHLTTVRHVKSQSGPVPLTWVETDTSEVFLADVTIEGNRWTPIVVDKAEDALDSTADIVGTSCGADIVVLDAAVPHVEPGDVIALLDTGAYQDSNGSNFNALARPATVLVKGATAELIKRRETVGDVFSRDVVPARLRPSSAPASTVLGLDHVSISSADIDRSLAFYRDLLGVSVMKRGEAIGEDAGVVTGFGDSHVRFADLDLGDGRVLELLQFVAPAGPPLEPELQRPGAGHIALLVEDADATHRALRAAGVAVRSEPVELDEPGHWNGARCFYATDPDGVTVEMVERPATRGEDRRER